MLERIVPVSQFLLVGFLLVAALIQRVTEIVVTLALQTGITGEQGLAEGLERLVVVFQLVSGGAGIELELIFSTGFRMRLQRVLKFFVSIFKFALLIRVDPRDGRERRRTEQH